MSAVTTTTLDVIAWLGDAADITSAAQCDELRHAFHDIEAVYPHHRDVEQREAATGAGMLILEEATLEEITEQARSARDAEHASRWRLHGAVIAALNAGMSEMEAARVTGLSRQTVRRLNGKAS